MASSNNVFTHRRTSRLGHGTGRKNPTEWQHDTSFLLTASRPANHISRVIEQFKEKGRREYNNVMRKIEEMYLMKVGSMMLEEQLIKIMWTREYLIRDLSLVQGLELSNWCIAAGYVRNYIWDYLHLKAKSTPLNDVDILYYDPNDLSEETEKKYEDLLRSQLNEYNWSIKNQARMHIRNHNQPYISIEDAMKRWPETATAVGIRIDKNSNIEVIAPHGLDDLFNLDVRISPYYKDRNIFLQRIKSKNWLELWPQLKIVEH